MGAMDLEIVEALWWLGQLRPEALPQIATDALVAGYDAPALWELAALPNADLSTGTALFAQALEELGRPEPVRVELYRRLAIEFARQITEGEVGAYEGARHIAVEVAEACPEVDVRAFSDMVEEWERHPERRQECEAAIVAGARALLASLAPGDE